LKATRTRIGFRGARVGSLMAVGLSFAIAAILLQPSPAAAAYRSNLQPSHAPLNFTSGYVQVSNYRNGLCIDDPSGSTNGARMILWGCNGASNQLWREISTGCGLGGPFESYCAVLQNESSGRCLDVWGASKANGTPAVQYSCNSNDTAEQFKIQPAAGAPGAPYWSVWASGIGVCLDDPNGSSAWGTQLQFYQCNQTASQTWYGPGWIGTGL
jgi:hypothetical protein